MDDSRFLTAAVTTSMKFASILSGINFLFVNINCHLPKFSRVLFPAEDCLPPSFLRHALVGLFEHFPLEKNAKGHGKFQEDSNRFVSPSLRHPQGISHVTIFELLIYKVPWFQLSFDGHLRPIS